ncbi:MAG: hypothetical protein QM791_04300 [Ferruginibacter sp.]
MENQIEAIKELLGNRNKVEFNPQVRVKKPEGHSIWIDDIYKVNDQLFCTYSTLTDNCKKRLDALLPDELKGIETRLKMGQVKQAA